MSNESDFRWCKQCGARMAPDAKFCEACGTPNAGARPPEQVVFTDALRGQRVDLDSVAMGTWVKAGFGIGVGMFLIQVVFVAFSLVFFGSCFGAMGLAGL